MKRDDLVLCIKQGQWTSTRTGQLMPADAQTVHGGGLYVVESTDHKGGFMRLRLKAHRYLYKADRFIKVTPPECLKREQEKTNVPITA